MFIAIIRTCVRIQKKYQTQQNNYLSEVFVYAVSYTHLDVYKRQVHKPSYKNFNIALFSGINQDRIVDSRNSKTNRFWTQVYKNVFPYNNVPNQLCNLDLGRAIWNYPVQKSD